MYVWVDGRMDRRTPDDSKNRAYFKYSVAQ